MDNFWTSSNVGAKAVKHQIAQNWVILEEDTPKAVAQFSNGTILVGFSGIFQIFVFVIVGNLLISLSNTKCGKASKVNGGIKILTDADFGFAGEILQLKFGFEGIIGNLNTPAFEIELSSLLQRELFLLQICQQSLGCTVGKSHFKHADRKILVLTGQRDPVLCFYGVNPQISLFSYPHNEEKPSVHRVSQEGGGGIPAVKQQQTALQPELQESGHMQL